jgi:hypothetical protein
MSSALMENRHGLIVDGRVSEANGTAERDEAEAMIGAVPGRHPITVGGDKAEAALRPAQRDRCDTQDFVASIRGLKATPHVAQNTKYRRPAIDGRTTRHPGYGLSQRTRKRLAELKGIAPLRCPRKRDRGRIEWQLKLSAAACDLIRVALCASGGSPSRQTWPTHPIGASWPRQPSMRAKLCSSRRPKRTPMSSTLLGRAVAGTRSTMRMSRAIAEANSG